MRHPLSARRRTAERVRPSSVRAACALVTGILMLLGTCAPGVGRADDLLAPCKHCSLLVGLGTTFRYFAWTDGLVLPVMLELDDSRWELGAFRFATAQRSAPDDLPPGAHAAEPYWGFSVMRRWQVLHRGSARLYVGFGGNYRTETDYLIASRWNFACLAAARLDLDSQGRALEVSVRHWSDAWIKLPDRGQNMLTLSVTF